MPKKKVFWLVIRAESDSTDKIRSIVERGLIPGCDVALREDFVKVTVLLLERANSNATLLVKNS